MLKKRETGCDGFPNLFITPTLRADGESVVVVVVVVVTTATPAVSQSCSSD
jgi:hypothetical protein